MAEVLTEGDASEIRNPRNIGPEALDRGLWAVDRLIIGYAVFASLLVIGWWNRIPAAPLLLSLHIVGIALLLLQIKRPNRFSYAFRHWYPLPYVASCYREMAILIPAIRGGDADRWLAELDYRFWGAHPTVWLERISSPALTEFLQAVYTLFVPAVLLVALLLWLAGRHSEFRYYAFLIAMGFLVSYIGYLMVPARGPRFLLRDLQTIPLKGVWLFDEMQFALDRLESAHYDCFPSGHTELTILAWWYSRLLSRPAWWIYSVYTAFLIFATVYLRYHYTIDVLAGAAAAFALIGVAPIIYRGLSQGR